MIRVRANQNFDDMLTGAHYKKGELLDFEDRERVRNMIKRNIAKLVHIPAPRPKHGNRIMVYQNLLFCIGGIETADYQLARAFPDRDLVFVFREADIDQALRLSQYAEVQIDEGTEQFETDVLILANYDSYPKIKGRVKARKIYQQVHADWANMKKMPQWANFTWEPDPDVDRIISVSETASKALKTAFKRKIESEVVPNILTEPEDSGFRVFLTLSRFTAEKGADLIVHAIQKFHAANKPFLWLIAGTMSNSKLDQALKHDKSVVFLEPNINNEALIRNCDILAQLSKNESYCYSVHQALAYGKPCLCTDIPEFRKVITPGYNGWLVDQHLQNLDPNAIFGPRLNPKPTKEEISPKWAQLLKGEL